MRKLIVVAVSLLSATAALAQQDKPNTLNVFLTNPGYVQNDISGSHYTGAYGLSLQRTFMPHVSVEAGLMRESRFAGQAGRTPVDLTARYHFFTDGSWKPYAGTGVRWVGGRAFLGVDGGVVWQFHRSLGLRFDGKYLFGDRIAARPSLDGSIGLNWRF